MLGAQDQAAVDAYLAKGGTVKVVNRTLEEILKPDDPFVSTSRFRQKKDLAAARRRERVFAIAAADPTLSARAVAALLPLESEAAIARDMKRLRDAGRLPPRESEHD